MRNEQLRQRQWLDACAMHQISSVITMQNRAACRQHKIFVRTKNTVITDVFSYSVDLAQRLLSE
jgi:hypothetical protein